MRPAPHLPAAMSRRRLLAAAGLSLAAPAWAQPAFPGHVVKIVVPFPPGGITDAAGRLIASRLEERWKVPVLLDQKPGAGGAIAASQLMQSPADGHTLLMASNSMLLTQLVYRGSAEAPPFDMLRDFMPVSLVGVSPLVLLVSGQMGVRNLVEFSAAMKANPGKYNYGTIGVGSSLHLYGDQLARRLDAAPVSVPQKGGAVIVNELIAGRLDYSFMDQMTGRAFVEAGTLKAIAVASPRRTPLYAGVPTFTEAGMTGFDTSSWYGFFVARGTPAALVKQLSADLAAVLKEPDVIARLGQTGTEVRGGTPEEFAQLISSDVQAWSQMIKQANLSTK